MYSSALCAVSRCLRAICIVSGHGNPVRRRSRRRRARATESPAGHGVDNFRLTYNIIEVQARLQHAGARHGQVCAVWTPHGDWGCGTHDYRIHLAVWPAEHHRHSGAREFCEPGGHVNAQFSVFVLSRAADLYIAQGRVAYVDNQFEPPMLSGRTCFSGSL